MAQEDFKINLKDGPEIDGVNIIDMEYEGVYTKGWSDIRGSHMEFIGNKCGFYNFDESFIYSVKRKHGSGDLRAESFDLLEETLNNEVIDTKIFEKFDEFKTFILDCNRMKLSPFDDIIEQFTWNCWTAYIETSQCPAFIYTNGDNGFFFTTNLQAVKDEIAKANSLAKEDGVTFHCI